MKLFNRGTVTKVCYGHFENVKNKFRTANMKKMDYNFLNGSIYLKHSQENNNEVIFYLQKLNIL